MEDNKFFAGLFDKLGSKIKMLFDDKHLKDKEIAEKALREAKSLFDGLETIKETIKGKTDKEVAKAIESLQKELKQKELSVNVEAPIVNVPDLKVIPETKHAERTVHILGMLLKQAMSKLDDGGGVRILNQAPSEAVPVVLTDPTKKKFYKAMNEVINAIAGNTAVPSFFNESNLDSFGRLRVSNPETLFDSKQIHDDQTLFWDDQEVTGGGTSSTFDGDKASTTIAVAENTAGLRVRQTFMRFNYQPGKSQLSFMTGTLGARATGVTKRFGNFDGDNGIFLEQTEDGVFIVLRSSVTGSAVDTRVAQADWSQDILNGQGASKRLLDDTKSQILVIDYEWLGVGSVRVGFVINGQIIYVHKFHHANINSGVYTSNPNYPLRYEIEATGTNDASSLEHICSNVISEGGTQDIGTIFSADTSVTQLVAATAGTAYALIGIRLKTTHIGEIVKLINLSLIVLSNQNVHWELLLNPAVAGTFTYSEVDPESGVESAIGATANVITGGTKMAGGYISSTERIIGEALSNARRLGSAIDGTVDEFVIAITPFNNNTNISGGINFREIA